MCGSLANALDRHTVDNRNRRKELQESRIKIGNTTKAMAARTDEGNRVMQNLYASVETNLALAQFAETWSWKEAEAKAPSSAPHDKGADVQEA